MDKKKSEKNYSTTNVKKFAKNFDKPIENEKEAQTPKTNLHNPHFAPGTNFGFPAPKQSIALTLKILNKNYDFYEKAMLSNKQIGSLKSFSYNTFHGLYKKINEDKIIVVSQIKKPASSKLKTWPKISYFGIFDGHGGEGCSEFLKNNFLNYLIENKNFPFDIKTSLIETFEKVEEEFF